MRSMTLRVQLLLLQVLIVCVVTVGTGVVAGALQERAIRHAYQDRMQAVALSVAHLPAILEALDDDDPAATIQPIAEVIREASDVTYVVVTDAEGIRYSHPNPERIGEMVSTDPSVPLSGEIYVGTQTGTLGTSWRVKVPIWLEDEIVGTVSVGILESDLSDEFVANLYWLLIAMGGSAVLGVLGAALVTAIIRRRIYRLEPREIASLVENRETTLHRLSEGVVTVDEHGTIELVNDAAANLLGAQAADLTGRPAREALGSALVEVLEQGEQEGRLVLADERVLIARSTGTHHSGEAVAATLLLRDHTELHETLRRVDGAQSLTDGLRAQAHEFANAMHVVAGLLEIGRGDEARAFISRRTPGGSIGLRDDATLLDDPELTALLSVKAAQARELGIDLDVSQTGSLERAIDDDLAADLVTILGNLVDNAIEACGVGDRVEVAVDIGATSLGVTVDDSGAGVPEHLRGWIFTEGMSTKGPDGEPKPGRGIGLALVRRVVERRRGSIEVEEAPIGGARFRLVIPRVARRTPRKKPAKAAG
ncbi:sensor histidine kinase [Pseudolysinimonas yzui]|nr:sensor histidine kinase [Pseudolysinimonas yzui]